MSQNETYFDKGEGVFEPEQYTQHTRGKIYRGPNAWNDCIAAEVKAPQPIKPRPPIPNEVHVCKMQEARQRYTAAVADKRAREIKSANLQEKVYELMNQATQLQKDRIKAIESQDKNKLKEINQEIEIIQYQICKKKAEISELQEEDNIRDLQREMREAERNFYAQLLDSYKREVTAGTCNLPFSILLRRAFALGTRCGAGGNNIKDYLFQWVSPVLLTEEQIKEVLVEIEKEYINE